MKKLFVFVVAAAVLCAFALPNLFAGDAADGIKMDKTSQPVTFNHSTHTEENCEFCHHKSGGDTAAIKSCSSEGCHDVFDKTDKTEASYYKVIHGKHDTIPTCVSCHREKAGSDVEKKKELTGCKKSACHP
jgi:cytochrome c553